MDLAWKILGIVAAVLLATSAVFSYLGKDAVKQELQLAQRAKDNLQATRDRAVEADDSLKLNTNEFAQAETDRDAASKEVEETNAEEAEYTAEIASRKVDLEQIKKQVADIKIKIRELGSIEKLLADVKKIEDQVSAAEAEIVNRDQKLKIAVEKVEAVNNEISDFTELERRQRKGLVAEDFKANVSNVFPSWGFVLLNKGNKDGVYANAELEIERGGQKLGRLFVTRVEQDRSVASLVANTWTPGVLPQAGDLVVRAPLPEMVEGQKDEAGSISPADAGFGGADAGPAGPAAPASDPFGGMGEAPAPAGGDPFGDTGGAKSEPAAPSSDPFGGF